MQTQFNFNLFIIQIVIILMLLCIVIWFLRLNRTTTLEKRYIGLLLNHPKYITKYYFLYDICLFENQELLNVYKSVLFFEGAEYASELAKKDFNFSKDNADVYQYKQKIKMDVAV